MKKCNSLDKVKINHGPVVLPPIQTTLSTKNVESGPNRNKISVI